MNKESKRLLRFFVMCIALASLQAGRAQAQSETVMDFSVTEAQEYAVEHNLNVRNAQLDVIQADKKIWETTATGLPQISGSVSMTNNLSLATQYFPNFIEPTIMGILMEQGVIPPQEIPEPEDIEVQFGRKYTAGAGIEVSQLIFSGPYIVGLQASKVYKKLSQESLEKTKLESKASVAQTYFLALMAGYNRQILEENLQTVEQTLSESEKMQAQGFLDVTSVDQIRIQASSLDVNLESTKRQYFALLDMLKVQMGLDITKEIALTDSLSGLLSQMALSGEVASSFDVEQSIDYKMAQTQVELNELEHKRQRYNNLPALSAFYSYQQNAQRDAFNFFDGNEDWFESAMIGLQLNIPIFSSGQRYSKIQQAELSVEKARNNRELARQNLKLQLKRSQNDYLTALGNYQAQKTNRETARRVYRQTRTKFAEGMASSSELLQANSQYLQVQSGYVGAAVELLNAKIALEKLMNEL